MSLRKYGSMLIGAIVILFLSFIVFINVIDLRFRSDDEAIKSAFVDIPLLMPEYVRNAQKQYSYILAGNRQSKNAVVFIHGSPGSANNYLDYFKLIDVEDSIKYISVDRNGYGWSNFGKSEKSLQGQADHIFSILMNEHIDGALLVGHSYGCPVATKMAIEENNLIRGLILISAPISAELEPPTWWRKILNVPGVRNLIPPALRVCNEEILALGHELDMMQEELKTISAPTTTIIGKEDRLVSINNADFIGRNLTGSELTFDLLDDKGHFILWSETGLIMNHIERMKKEIF